MWGSGSLLGDAGSGEMRLEEGSRSEGGATAELFTAQRSEHFKRRNDIRSQRRLSRDPAFGILAGFEGSAPLMHPAFHNTAINQVEQHGHTSGERRFRPVS